MYCPNRKLVHCDYWFFIRRVRLSSRVDNNVRDSIRNGKRNALAATCSSNRSVKPAFSIDPFSRTGNGNARKRREVCLRFICRKFAVFTQLKALNPCYAICGRLVRCCYFSTFRVCFSSNRLIFYWSPLIPADYPLASFSISTAVSLLTTQIMLNGVFFQMLCTIYSILLYFSLINGAGLFYYLALSYSQKMQNASVYPPNTAKTKACRNSCFLRRKSNTNESILIRTYLY